MNNSPFSLYKRNLLLLPLEEKLTWFKGTKVIPTPHKRQNFSCSGCLFPLCGTVVAAWGSTWHTRSFPSTGSKVLLPLQMPWASQAGALRSCQFLSGSEFPQGFLTGHAPDHLRFLQSCSLLTLPASTFRQSSKYLLREIMTPVFCVFWVLLLIFWRICCLLRSTWLAESGIGIGESYKHASNETSLA